MPAARWRALGGAQSYPSRTKDVDDVDFSTGSVGLGVAMTLFSSIVQDYVRLKNLGDGKRPTGRMVALVGDAELDEGNIFEALLEGWKHDVRNLWWVIDYNRQSLDSVVPDRLFGRIEGLFRDMGWNVVTINSYNGSIYNISFEDCAFLGYHSGGVALNRMGFECTERPNPTAYNYHDINLIRCTFQPQGSEAISYDGNPVDANCLIEDVAVYGAGNNAAYSWKQGFEINGPKGMTVNRLG